MITVRRLGAGFTLLLLVGSGCTTTLRELRTQPPRVDRQAAGAPLGIARCVQDYLEDRHGGLWGRLGGLGYETRTEAATTYLVGRILMNPADVLFDLALTPTTADRVAVHLRGSRRPSSKRLTRVRRWRHEF